MSTVELIALSTSLCYKLHLITDENERLPKDKTKNDYIFKSLEILKILDNYESSYIDMRVVNQIKKEFGLNRLYK